MNVQQKLRLDGREHQHEIRAILRDFDNHWHLTQYMPRVDVPGNALLWQIRRALRNQLDL